MSINLEHYIWPASFSCTIITDKIILPNHYTISIGIEPVAPQQIANGFRRMRCLIDTLLDNSVFVCDTNIIINAIEPIDTNVVYFPSEPYDYAVGCILLQKFTAITQKYFDIGFITIDSAVGDHIQYCITDPEETGLKLAGDHWWNKDSLNTGSEIDISWDDLDLNDRPKFEPRVVKGGRGENQ
jgi:hypothetical protein